MSADDPGKAAFLAAIARWLRRTGRATDSDELTVDYDSGEGGYCDTCRTGWELTLYWQVNDGPQRMQTISQDALGSWIGGLL